MTDLSPDTLAAIKARADAALSGEWTPAIAPHDPRVETKQEFTLIAFHPDQADEPLWVVWTTNLDDLSDADYVITALTGDGPRSRANAEFIAAARTDVPTLLAAYEAVTAERDTLKALLQSAANCCARSPLCIPRQYAEEATNA